MATRTTEKIDGVVNALDAAWKRRLRRRMLSWFSRHARELPWRATRDLYHIWVSEVMLQQTQVVTVIDYFQRFVKRLPNVCALAAADESEVLRLWEGLGYYRRARYLHQAARVIVDQHGGDIPVDAKLLHSLPGVGRYTANAILSIGRNARLPILEANTIRLLSRLMAFRGDPASQTGQNYLWNVAEEILPRVRVGAFNQSLMELGSQVCTPREPRCEVCPVAALCGTFRLGMQDQIPSPKRKVPYESVVQAAMVICRGRRFLLRQCESEERWAGMWDFPRFDLSTKRDGAKRTHELIEKTRDLVGVSIVPLRRITSLKHGVTRFRITLHCHEAEFASGRVDPPARWVSRREMETLPLSVTGRRIAKLLSD